MFKPYGTEYVLKPCPFCGSEAKMFKMSSNGYFVRCSNHKCSAEQMVYRSETEAADWWNMSKVRGD